MHFAAVLFAACDAWEAASERRSVRPFDLAATHERDLAIVRAQAFLKSPRQIWRTFGQMPAVLEASVEIAERCQFRLPLRRSKLAAERKEPLGQACCSGCAGVRRG